MRPLLVFGARPNFMKIAPVYRAMQASGSFDPVLVHTGQHFDRDMSGDFLDLLGLHADFHLGIGADTQAQQIAAIIAGLEPVYAKVRPDITVVVGDVSSTLAGALVSDMVGVPIAHVEAGLRSRNWDMPEERNRVLTDRMARWLFTPSTDADTNLATEGIDSGRVHLVGNVMIDSLEWVTPHLDVTEARKRYGVADAPYGLATLHRPASVDDPIVLEGLLKALVDVSNDLPLLFSLHPRTRQQLNSRFGSNGELEDVGAGLRLVPPIGYLDFVALLSEASLVLTDSGGIQEEATVLGVRCLTLRTETERPITLEGGVNEVVGTHREDVVSAARRRLHAGPVAPVRPPLWDGRASHRIVGVLEHSSLGNA